MDTLIAREICIGQIRESRGLIVAMGERVHG
jgi:hypothetical protein